MFGNFRFFSQIRISNADLDLHKKPGFKAAPDSDTFTPNKIFNYEKNQLRPLIPNFLATPSAAAQSW
jgi:hypothetical protein